jgi:hypothetical protein
MKIVLAAILCLGCSSAVEVESQPVELDLPTKVETAKLTICADLIAAELEPAITRMIRASMAYWSDLPDFDRYEVLDPGACDVPVRFGSEDDYEWNHRDGMVTRIVGNTHSIVDVESGELKSGRCKAKRVLIRESRWEKIKDSSLKMLTHEFGHVLCMPHLEAEGDIMNGEVRL